MSSYELAIYIQKELETNTPKDKIVSHLIAAGWKQKDIEEAFAAMNKNSEEPLSAVAFPEFMPRRAHNWRFVRGLVIFFLCVAIVFVTFSIVFDLGLIGPQAQYPTMIISTTTQSIVATTSSAIPTTVQTSAQPTESSTISSSDKNQIITAILTKDAILKSGDASTIRNYLEITAATDYRQQLSAMSDSDILSLASSMLSGDSAVTANSMNSPSANWQMISPTSVQVTIQTANGPVTRTSSEVDGVWY